MKGRRERKMGKMREGEEGRGDQFSLTGAQDAPPFHKSIVVGSTNHRETSESNRQNYIFLPLRCLSQAYSHGDGTLAETSRDYKYTHKKMVNVLTNWWNTAQKHRDVCATVHTLGRLQ